MPTYEEIERRNPNWPVTADELDGLLFALEQGLDTLRRLRRQMACETTAPCGIIRPYTTSDEGSTPMEILVKKPSEAEIATLQSQPTWECEVSEFDWYYDAKETALLLEGEVTVEYEGGSASFGAGDYVVFPKGMACVWKVTKPVKKHYIFE